MKRRQLRQRLRQRRAALTFAQKSEKRAKRANENKTKAARWLRDFSIVLLWPHCRRPPPLSSLRTSARLALSVLPSLSLCLSVCSLCCPSVCRHLHFSLKIIIYFIFMCVQNLHMDFFRCAFFTVFFCSFYLFFLSNNNNKSAELPLPLPLLAQFHFVFIDISHIFSPRLSSFSFCLCSC